MSDTIREKIIKQFLTRAAVIRTTNGYNTDIGVKVERATQHPEKLPAVALFPYPETAEPGYGELELTMQIRVEAMVEYGSVNPSIVSELILGDLIRAFTDPAWDRRAVLPSPVSPPAYGDTYDSGIFYQGGGTNEYPDEEDRTVGTFALFAVKYSTKPGNPYEQ